MTVAFPAVMTPALQRQNPRAPRALVIAALLSALVGAAPEAQAGGSPRNTLIVDFDDTLVRTQPLYDDAKRELAELAKSAGLDPTETLAAFDAEQRRTIAKLGFSRERFPSAMKAAVAGLGGDAELAKRAYAIGDAVFERRARNYPHAEALLSTLKQAGWNVIVLTKGDTDVQRTRVFSSGLVDHLDAVEIVSSKRASTYRNLIKKYDLDPERVWVAGNSLRSDVLPAIEAGVAADRAVLLTSRASWAHERAEGAELPPDARTATSLADVGTQLGFSRLEQPARTRERTRDPLVRDIRRVLTADLLKPRYRARPLAGADRATGHCYVAVEALYHLEGGPSSQLKPHTIRHEGEPHWFLRDGAGKVRDPTASQFKTPVPYDRGRGCGFLTGDKPSARAREVMRRVEALRRL